MCSLLSPSVVFLHNCALKTTTAPAKSILKANRNCLRIWSRFDVRTWSQRKIRTMEWLSVRLGREREQRMAYCAPRDCWGGEKLKLRRPRWWALSAWLGPGCRVSGRFNEMPCLLSLRSVLEHHEQTGSCICRAWSLSSRRPLTWNQIKRGLQSCWLIVLHFSPP